MISVKQIKEAALNAICDIYRMDKSFIENKEYWNDEIIDFNDIKTIKDGQDWIQTWADKDIQEQIDQQNPLNIHDLKWMVKLYEDALAHFNNSITKLNNKTK